VAHRSRSADDEQARFKQAASVRAIWIPAYTDRLRRSRMSSDKRKLFEEILREVRRAR
jgi:hypothetical protein